jgi:hypothetical protein
MHACPHQDYLLHPFIAPHWLTGERNVQEAASKSLSEREPEGESYPAEQRTTEPPPTAKQAIISPRLSSLS